MPKYRLSPDVLLSHSARCFFHVSESLGLDRGGVSDYCLVGRIHLQHCAATGASHFERGSVLRHGRNDTANQGFQRGCSLIGRILNRKSISQPSSSTDTTTTRTASNSPKLRCLRSGSRRLPTRLRILMVAKPKTSAHRMLYTSPFLLSNCQKASSNQYG